MTPEPRIRRIVKPLVFVLCLIPLAWLVWRGLSGGLGANPIEAINRFLGDWAFTFASLQLSSYVVLDQFFNWAEIWADIVKRNFITVGMIAFLLLLPLAVTSTNAMVRRLGGKWWQRLHRLVYPATIAVIIHFYMMVKADVREPLVYGAIAAALLGYRTVLWFKARKRRGRAGAQAA